MRRALAAGASMLAIVAVCISLVEGTPRSDCPGSRSARPSFCMRNALWRLLRSWSLP
jgi:hypothetical protein